MIVDRVHYVAGVGDLDSELAYILNDARASTLVYPPARPYLQRFVMGGPPFPFAHLVSRSVSVR